MRKLAFIASLLIAATLASAQAQTRAVTIFAGGCFWCMEPPFDKVDGVLATTSGYTGGTRKDPTYEQVSAGRTGHYEALQVDYDPARVATKSCWRCSGATSTPWMRVDSSATRVRNIARRSS